MIIIKYKKYFNNIYKKLRQLIVINLDNIFKCISLSLKFSIKFHDDNE